MTFFLVFAISFGLVAPQLACADDTAPPSSEKKEEKKEEAKGDSAQGPQAPAGEQPATIASEGLGWPFAALGPRSPSTLPARDALLLGALGGWWMHCAGWTMDSRDTTMVLGFVLGLSPLARLLCYLASHLPPISLWGRIRTGRWVIPGYDRVFIAPLAAWAGGALLLLALHSAGVAVEGCAPVVVAFVMATVLGLGPGRREWQLTGQHRIVFHPAGGVVQQGGAKVG